MSEAQDNVVLVKQNGPVTIVTFNRPHRLNAWNPEFISRLAEVTKDITRSQLDTRVVVFTGAGRSFSAGGDMDMFRDGLEPSVSHRVRGDLADIFDSVVYAPQIFIAAIQGHCVGSALVLAGCCDFRICTQEAQFHFAEIHMGMLPGIGVARISHVVPDRMLRALLIAGRKYTSMEAYNAGFIDTVVEENFLTRAAFDLGAEIISKPEAAVSFAKQIASQARSRDVRVAHDFEALANSLLLARSDVRERAGAFLERSRKPGHKE